MLDTVERSDPEALRMTVTPTAPPTREESVPEGLTAEGQPPPVALSVEAGAILLRIARSVVAATASGRLQSADVSSLVPRDPPAEVLAPAAAFVTLYLGGELRGCVGCLASGLPLWESVVSAAESVATRDWRFPPVTESEVPSLSIDISVLGPPVPLKDPSEFRPGVDGLIVERAGRRGLLLPEVATDHGWGVSEMLMETCWKAGLPEDAWRDKLTLLLVFRTARISEVDAND
jgi:AmmeMemoRadiSam system protein A